jgi:ATP phosphoribosyltransferase regulatory subunit
MSAWVLPDHVADVLPSEARHIEELRRELLDTARSYGYELVMPPLFEHLESLLSGTGEALDLQTFKLVDQLSGRMLGLRADTTPQVARIDAHLLNRQGVTRLCYCGPVAHTRPDRPHATREPLQLGAELYGHAGLEADLEVMSLALNALQAAGVPEITVDLGDARVVRSVLAGVMVDAQVLGQVHQALASKDASALSQLTHSFPTAAREGLQALVGLYGGIDVLEQARHSLPSSSALNRALDELQWLVMHLSRAGAGSSTTGLRISIDLADARGYAYYSGVRFAMYSPSAGDALARGGRYDEVGSVFGRNRPAVGFSMDLKMLVAAVPGRPQHPAILAPWFDHLSWRAAVSALRERGETVVCLLPGQDHVVDEFLCDRELVSQAGRWIVQPL